MSTVLSRTVASTPARTTMQTWEAIVELVAPDPTSDARKELTRAAGVACASIAAEAPSGAPIVVWGGGPRVRIYCVFGENAVTGDGVNEDALSKSPTSGEWRMSIPFEPEDVKWANAKLANISSRLSARAIDDDVEDNSTETARSARSMAINSEEFLRP